MCKGAFATRRILWKQSHSTLHRQAENNSSRNGSWVVATHGLFLICLLKVEWNSQYPKSSKNNLTPISTRVIPLPAVRSDRDISLTALSVVSTQAPCSNAHHYLPPAHTLKDIMASATPPPAPSHVTPHNNNREDDELLPPSCTTFNTLCVGLKR